MTSRIWLVPEAETRTRAPIAERFDFVPTHFTRIAPLPLPPLPLATTSRFR